MKSKLCGFLLCLAFITQSVPPAVATPEDEASQTRLAVKRVFKHIDEKWIDAAIVTGFSSSGGAVGNRLTICVSSYIWPLFGGHFVPSDHYEDEAGAAAGAIIGYHLGHFAVRVRHRFTDRAFPAIGQMAYACGAAGKRFILNQCDRATSGFVGFLGRCAGWLNGYADANKTK